MVSQHIETPGTTSTLLRHWDFDKAIGVLEALRLSNERMNEAIESRLFSQLFTRDLWLVTRRNLGWKNNCKTACQRRQGDFYFMGGCDRWLALLGLQQPSILGGHLQRGTR